MPKIILALTATLLSLCLNQATFAAIPAQPSACPSVSEIQKAGLALAKELESGSGSYLAFQQNRYRTENTWGFLVGIISADSSTEALSLARKALTDLKLEDQVPVYSAQHKVWVCNYSLASSYMGVAITPLPSMPQAKLFLRK